VLGIHNLSVFHGSLQVIYGLDFKVQKGELVALLGPNGAGKTSLVETIFGLNTHAFGTIHFLGESILRLSTHVIVRKGLVLIPERREIFPRMSVLENLELGEYGRKESGDTLEHVFTVFPILKQRKNQIAGTLSGGEQQMLAIGRGLMSGPKMLVLDEPSTGLSPLLVSQVFESLKGLREEGVTILLLEQNVRQALEICNWGVILENGRIVLNGPPEELLENKNIQTAYLGL
jgi:branched-chain amino acid transport system ATP-binding protein